MTGRENRVLYVGQSGNLRQRLAFYKNVDFVKASGKLRRLIDEVRAITWEKCVDTTHARLRENELLRLYEPRHNVVNARARSYMFISVAFHECAFRLSLGMQKPGSEQCYGAFKARGATIAAVAALARLLLINALKPASLYELPANTLRNRATRNEKFSMTSFPQLDRRDARELLHSFLDGSSDALINYLQTAICEWASERDHFTRSLVDNDLRALEYFYASGPLRNAALKVFGRQA